MFIQCLIPRRTGTPVTLSDGAKISFQPNEHGDHVCDVKDKDHIKQLLRHKGCYRPYNSEESRLEKEEAERQKRLQEEQQAQGASNPNPGEGDKTGGDGKENPDAGEVEGDKPLTEDQLNAMDRDALADHFEKLAGKKPHHNAGKDKLIEAILSHKKAPDGDKA